MTSQIATTSAETTLRRISLKGKYLAPFEKFASSVVLDENFQLPVGAELDALIDTITALHSAFLTRESATAIVFRETYLFAGEYGVKGGSLADPANAPLKAALVARLKDYIESLPRTYTLRIELPAFTGFGRATRQISEHIRLVTDAHVFSVTSNDQLNAMASVLMAYGNRPSYLEIQSFGYADGSPESPAVLVGISLAKQFAFIVTVFNAFTSSYSQSVARATLTTEATQVVASMALPFSLARCFGRLKPNEEKLVVYESQKGLKSTLTILTDQGRPATTEDEKSQTLNRLLSHAVRFFGSKDHPDFPSIAAAIEWYQDSIFAENQTFAYIAACIGLEAVLGSDEYLSEMSKRLGDRYAFLLGKGRAERDRLAKDYTEVLNVRGKLVHAKAATLDGEGKKLLRKAQDMLLKTIWHELHQMYRDDDKLRGA